MPLMSDYRIEKLRRSVRVVLENGAAMDGDVFLQTMGRFRAGPEEPADLLNDAEPFFALALAQGGALLLAKDRVARVETDLHDADNPLDSPALGLLIELTLADGSACRGTVFPETRAERPRLLDFLNSYEPRFLAVYDAERVTLVNRRIVTLVREVRKES